MLRIRRNNYIKYGVILLIVFISIGYALVSSNLNILGNAKINSVKWNVHFENVQVKTGSVSATIPSITDDTKVSYNVILNEPGNFYEFTVDVVNQGGIDAVIDKLNIDGLTDTQKKYLDYSVTYNDLSTIKVDDQLLSGKTKVVLVKIKYRDDINASDLPSDGVEINLDVELNYVQLNGEVSDEEEVIPSPSPSPSSPPVEDEEEVVNPLASLISDKLVTGYSWVSNSNKTAVFTKSTDDTRSTVSEPLSVNAGDKIVVKQSSTYVFGYFFLTLEDDGLYHYSTDPGWQSRLANQDIIITVPSDGKYLVTNWKKTNNGKLTDADTEAIKELITYVPAN